MFLLDQNKINASLSKRDVHSLLKPIAVSVAFIVVMMIVVAVTVAKRRKKAGERIEQDSAHNTMGLIGVDEDPPTPIDELQQSATPTTAPHPVTPDALYKFVPPYSKTAQGSNDRGYFDPEGKFHAIGSFNLPSAPSTCSHSIVGHTRMHDHMSR
ncbi:hypothetical protein Cantr_04350 [Candida viswanathii]|uniref:Uncharacterized protein n=1 Tax=Candida viswanathii TaxID=5486 RepID=A0A367XL56_9ASCO|nr:hypothetical protein Cantr_04350 [Candida viswanathii]